MDKPIVVLDANAFISAQSLLQLGADHRLITTSDVIQELRDAKTREMLQKFPFQIQQMQCDKKSLAIVKQFARKTGDISSLSDVDMELIALTYILYQQNGKVNELRKQPPPMKEYVPKQGEEETYSSDDQEEINEEEGESESDKQIEETQQQETNNNEVGEESKQKSSLNKLEKQGDKVQGKSENEDDDDGWIVVPKKKNKVVEQSDEDIDENEGWVTPQNYEQKMAENTATFSQEKGQNQDPLNSIWLMTADFAMQNVAIQMGMLLKSLDGRKITQVRRFIMECYLCWKKYKIQSNKVKLCKQCGYNSLSKIAYSMSGDGKMILHRKKGWKPNQKVMEWKEKKYQQDQKKKKHQHARRKKQASIFDA